jgi:hypothetical protein
LIFCTKGATPITAPEKNYNYIYRVNCGGPDYTDQLGINGRLIRPSPTRPSAKPNWGSVSWTNDFKGMPAFFASQRKTNDPIKGTHDWKLFQSFRYGREKLSYIFPVPDGEYLVELYFIEPWFGAGGGMDCSGWRLFDVAINDKTFLKILISGKKLVMMGLEENSKAECKRRKANYFISFSSLWPGRYFRHCHCIFK